MLAHEQLTADQVQLMVRWIYSLEPGRVGLDLVRGLVGKVSVPDDLDNRIGILEANYTDAGRGLVGTLVGKTTVKLRSRRVEAEAGIEPGGVAVLGAGHASGKKLIRANADGGTLRYSSLDLSDAVSVTCRVAAAKTGGKIELRRDSADGEMLAFVEARSTGAWNVWEEVKAPLKAVDKRCDVVVVFKSPGPTNFLSLDWLQFNAK